MNLFASLIASPSVCTGFESNICSPLLFLLRVIFERWQEDTFTLFLKTLNFIGTYLFFEVLHKDSGSAATAVCSGPKQIFFFFLFGPPKL